MTSNELEIEDVKLLNGSEKRRNREREIKRKRKKRHMKKIRNVEWDNIFELYSMRNVNYLYVFRFQLFTKSRCN